MEGEEDYTIEKLWGLGPLKKELLVENPQDVVNLERYKVIIYMYELFVKVCSIDVAALVILYCITRCL